MHKSPWKIIATAVISIAIAGACSSSSKTAQPETDATTSTTQPASYPLDGTLRLNEIQVLGSHNSYHHQPYPEVLAALKNVNVATAAGLDYGHPPLNEQFDLGVRQIELDLYADPDGGKFAEPSLPKTLGLPAPDPAIMNEPGFKVIHQVDIDTRSTCLTFVLCLEAVKTWSDAHPGHAPMMIEVEMKDKEVTAATFDALDAEIRSVFSPEDLITPDDVRGTDPSLGHTVRTRGWPTLGESRGRVLLTLDNESFTPIALEGHPSLSGRMLFAPSKPGDDHAAFAKLNDPIKDAPKIAAALAAHMLVRTRADADTVQARSNDTTMRDAAFKSGAQFVSTDYEIPDTRFSAYTARIPGGTPARCSPETARPSCKPTDVENPDFLESFTP